MYFCKEEKNTMSLNEKNEAFYKKLKQELTNTSLWPTLYLYKFIVKSDADKIIKIEGLFNNMGAVINTSKSKNGNYTSVSINVKMKNPDAVILKYLEVADNIEGVISL